MNFIIKKKWLVILLWIAAIAVLLSVSPNMGKLVEEKGEITVPDEYSSAMAQKILNDVQAEEGGEDGTSVALVFYNEDKLSQNDIKEAEKGIEILEKEKDELGITKILSHFNEEALKDQLVSDDGKAILASISLEWKDRDPKEVKEALYKALEEIDVEHYYTSEWIVNHDLIESSQEGLKKTEGITVVFILAVLLLVFRSFVAPLIPLVTVGISYLASQSVVALLIDSIDFPVSTYTQIFLVVVLFGIGTDYIILLLSRFKEELAERETIPEAIIETYRHGGKTVLYSGIAVMIGFATIGMSEFILYQSAAAVAIGVGVLLIALFTIVPFFMALLGPKLFWPSKGKTEHGDSKIWSFFGHFSLSRPLLSLLLVAVVCVPFLIAYDGVKSYDSMKEIGGDVGSIKAFDAISESFSPGEAMPTQIVVKNDERMDSQEYLSLAEKISSELGKVDSVKTVRSVTRPTGEPLEDFLIAKQAETLEKGLGEGNEGIKQIRDGLSEASKELRKSEPELKKASEGIGELISGTDQLKSGLSEIQTNLAKVEEGIRQGSAGSDQLKQGLEEAKAGAEQMLSLYETQILAGYETIGKNLSDLNKGYSEVGTGLGQLSAGFEQVHNQLFGYLEGRFGGDLTGDPNYLGLKQGVQELDSQLNGLANAMNELNAGLSGIKNGLDQANNGFSKALEQGSAELGSGLQALIDGIEKQQAGLDQLADGQGLIVDNMPKLTDGLSGINEGQKQLLDGFGGLDEQINELSSGLSEGSDGLNQVAEGLDSARDYLSRLTEAEDMAGYYIPEEVLDNEDFEVVLDTYLSEDRKVMTIDVILEDNPYSNEAMAKIDDMEEAVKRAVKDTKLENAVVAIGGTTSLNNDLDTMSGNDFARTVTFMLIGIGLILIVLFKSLIMPVYIIASLILTYFTSMAINEAIFVNMLGNAGISWAVPFFAFVILIALGVDYSIFLMNRFNEYKHLHISQAMFLAMKKMGTVIISAAIILGGTFAAMMPSGMMSLLQIASITIVGLMLYAFIILPLFVPVMVKNFGKANWWPFNHDEGKFE